MATAQEAAPDVLVAVPVAVMAVMDVVAAAEVVRIPALVAVTVAQDVAVDAPVVAGVDPGVPVVRDAAERAVTAVTGVLVLVVQDVRQLVLNEVCI